MVILVLNCGSSSIKYQVIDMEAQSSKLLAKGLVERIGLPEGDLTHKPVGKEKFELHQPIPDHTTGISLVLQALTDPVHGVIRSLDAVKAVGHRVAHGGEFFPESCLVTKQVQEKNKHSAVKNIRISESVPSFNLTDIRMIWSTKGAG